MPNPSNLYAEKVFAEHPLGLWSLDEQVDYLSKISETNRNLSLWQVSPLANVDYSVANPNTTDLVGVPFVNSTTKKITAIAETSLNEIVSLMPVAAPIPISTLNANLQTFSISFYTKALHSYSSGVQIGYCTVSSAPGATPVVGLVQNFDVPMPNEWSMYSATFDVPISPSVAFIIPFISFSYINQLVATGNPPGNPYSYVINGFTVGQLSESFNATSLGVESISYFMNEAGNAPDPTTLLAEGYVSGYQYGLGSNDAKYIVSNSELLAKNTSIPMVYGSSNLTKIVPHSANILFTNPPSGTVPSPALAYPSMLFPGFNMLHPDGRFNTYTFETWIRIDNRSDALRKIVGPMYSENGLYVEGPFIKLKVGNSIGSYFVGEWYRPMLIDLRLGLDYANLLINGEQVISISFDTATIPLQDARYTDFWGIFSYPDVPVVEIECPAFYSYIVPSAVAKRRFAYGQAVESPDGVNKSFGASTAFIDYAVADYTNNYQYPDMGKWKQGIVENLDLENNTLASPKYKLPDFIFQNSTYEAWLQEQATNAGEYFTFANKPGYIRFNDVNITSTPTKGVYVIFNVSSYSTQEKILFKLVDRLSGDSVTAVIVNDVINYKIKVNGVETTFFQQAGISINTNTFAGISFDQMSNLFGGDVQTFFSRSSQLIMFVAGEPSSTNTFNGKIYKIGLCTERNLNKISEFFDLSAIPLGDIDGGIPSTLVWDETLDGGTPSSFKYTEVFNHIATYTLEPYIKYNVYSLGVSSDSYWQDYLPLSYFSQYVTNIFGQPYIDLDFIQLNIDYPTNPTYIAGSYDTSNSLVRTYVSFQLLAEGATKQLSTFTNVKLPPSNNTIEVASGEWLNTAYEVVDGMIIYPPTDVSINSLAMVTHIEMTVKQSSEDQVAIKKLQYASQAFNSDTANPIGTKFNVPVYPYQKYAALFEYKSRNPYRIYKGSTPHLYLTKKTGLQKAGDYDSLINRGFLVQINEKQADEYRVIAAQMFLYYDADKFPSGTVKLFEIQSSFDYIKFYMQPLDAYRKRVRIYAQDAKTGLNKDGIAFYINGKIVKDPVLEINEWTALGVRFADPLPFDNGVGAIRVTGPLVVNNISYYESSSLQEVERQSYRLWDAINSNSQTWQDWVEQLNRFGESYLWRDVLVVASTRYAGVSPTDIYNSYVGANKIIGDDESTFYLGGVSYKTINQTSWSSVTLKPL